MGLKAWAARPESGWGVVGLIVLFVPYGVMQGMATFGGPWPGDSGLAILAWGYCLRFVCIPVGVTCSIVGMTRRGRRQIAGPATLAMAVCEIVAWAFEAYAWLYASLLIGALALIAVSALGIVRAIR